METAFKRQGGEINIYKTKKNGKRVDLIEVLTAQERIDKKIETYQDKEILILLAIVLVFLLTTILIVNIF